MDHDSFVAPLSGFGPGAMVMTSDGEMPVEWLEKGDRIITRDHGAQPILKMLRTRLVAPDGRALPVPLKIKASHAAGQGELIEDLRLSPFTRVMVKGPQVALHFGENEAMAQIGDLFRRRINSEDPECPALSYHHIITERHELMWTCGIWVETTPPETAALLDVPTSLRGQSEIFNAACSPPRMCLLPEESHLLRSLLLHEESLLSLIAA